MVENKNGGDESWEDMPKYLSILTNEEPSEIEVILEPVTVSNEPIITKAMVKKRYDNRRWNYTLRGRRKSTIIDYDKKGRAVF